MPRIVPIRDLKNTTEISSLCHNSSEPIFITKNGYGDMVIMSMEVYEQQLFLRDVENKLALAEKDIQEGKTKDAEKSLAEIRKKYGVQTHHNG